MTFPFMRIFNLNNEHAIIKSASHKIVFFYEVQIGQNSEGYNSFFHKYLIFTLRYFWKDFKGKDKE